MLEILEKLEEGASSSAWKEPAGGAQLPIKVFTISVGLEKLSEERE